jgi:hypothetical protein
MLDYCDAALLGHTVIVSLQVVTVAPRDVEVHCVEEKGKGWREKGNLVPRESTIQGKQSCRRTITCAVLGASPVSVRWISINGNVQQ